MFTHAVIKRPIIAILGTTGVGKTKLSVHLAHALNGEIINADVMQMYKGLPIITNKPSLSEQKGIHHHLIDFVDTADEYIVSDFERDALKLIDDIHGREKVPIIVGGTHYYLQSLLFQNSILSGLASTTTDQMSESSMMKLKDIVDEYHSLVSNSQCTTETFRAKMHSVLEEVDFVMAERWHPNNDRKVFRSLQICLETGRKHSDVLKEQHEQSLKPRFPTCLFWIAADAEVLETRLDERIDNMVESGLFEEIETAHRSFKALNIPINYERGIMQSIGYKEFHDYLESLASESSRSELAKLKASSIENMKIATRQYAKSQIKWIRNKTFPKCNAMHERGFNCPIYVLDSTDVARWEENVFKPALDISISFMHGNTLPKALNLNPMSKILLNQKTAHSKTSVWKRYTCDCCTETKADGTVIDKVIYGELEWNIHIKSRKHKKQLHRKLNPNPYTRK